SGSDRDLHTFPTRRSSDLDRANLSGVQDAAGGLVMDWYDYRSGGSNVFGQRVLPNATLAPGWPMNGLLISDPTDPNAFAFSISRSEDHTSELQSPYDLVCR